MTQNPSSTRTLASAIALYASTPRCIHALAMLLRWRVLHARPARFQRAKRQPYQTCAAIASSWVSHSVSCGFRALLICSKVARYFSEPQQGPASGCSTSSGVSSPARRRCRKPAPSRRRPRRVYSHDPECKAGFSRKPRFYTIIEKSGSVGIALRESCRRPEAVFAPAPGEDGGTVHVEAEPGAEKMVETRDFCGISGFAHFN